MPDQQHPDANLEPVHQPPSHDHENRANQTRHCDRHPIPRAKLHDAVDHEVSSEELSKWGEMISIGITQYMQSHPDRFHRRVRRGIPPKFRWQVWKAVARVQEYNLPSDEYYNCLSNETNAWTAQIEVDICRTFPELKGFDKEHQHRLQRVLNAYAGYNTSVGYCQGMNYVAGLLLLVSDSEFESFVVFVCLMDHMGLSGFYTQPLPLLRRYLRACDRLVAETVPELREHFIRENVQPAVYLHQWFLTLFINCFPLSMVMIIWDVIICEGLPVILRIAVSILQVLKDSLLTMHFEEIIKFFKMMKTYDDEDGELNAFRIGQLLMKHTEHVQIPEQILEYLYREPLEDEANLESDESWETDLNSGSWLQALSRLFTFSSARGRRSALPSRGEPGPSGPGPPLQPPPRTVSAPVLSSQHSDYALASTSPTNSEGSTFHPAGNSTGKPKHHPPASGSIQTTITRPKGAQEGPEASGEDDSGLSQSWEFL